MVSELRSGVRRIRSVDLAYRYAYVLSNMISQSHRLFSQCLLSFYFLATGLPTSDPSFGLDYKLSTANTNTIDHLIFRLCES